MGLKYNMLCKRRRKEKYYPNKDIWAYELNTNWFVRLLIMFIIMKFRYKIINIQYRNFR